MTRVLHGLELHRLGDKKLQMQYGEAESQFGTKRTIDITGSRPELDIDTNGLNGLDTGNPVNDTWYYVYAATDGVDHGAIISAAEIYSNVTTPVGDWSLRKLPFAIRYKGDKFVLQRPFKNRIDYTNFASDSNFRVLNDGNASVWTTVDLSSFVPPNAQMAILVCESLKATTGFLSSFVRTKSGGGNGYILDAVALLGGVSGYERGKEITLQTNSDQEIEYKWNGSNPGAKLDIFVKGYIINEPV